MKCRIEAGLALMLLVASSLANARVDEILRCDEVYELKFAASGNPVVLSVNGIAAWVEISEQGQQLIVLSPTLGAISLSQPLRLGKHLVPVSAGEEIVIERVETNPVASIFTAQAHCSPSFEAEAGIAWLRQLSKLDRRISSSKDRESLASAARDVAKLRTIAPDEKSVATTTHYLGLVYAAANDGTASIEQFRKAEELWAELGEPQRATAARVGRIAAMYSAGNLAGIVADTNALSSRSDGLSYFELRSLNERCLALTDMARVEEADRCYIHAAEGFRRSGEFSDQAAVLKNRASLQRRQGHLALAKNIANEGLKVAVGPSAPMLLGRLHSLLSVIAQQEGDIATALRENQLANDQLDRSKLPVLFERSSARLGEARLLEQIGAWSEAYDALAAVATFLPAQHSLGLRASIFADLEADTRHYESALFWYGIAEASYQKEGAVSARDWTRLARLRLLLERGDKDEAVRSLPSIDSLPAAYEGSRQILAAKFALRQGNLKEARAALSLAKKKVLSLDEKIQLTRTEAEYRNRNGDNAGAELLLRQMATRTHRLAMQTGNAVLREMVRRKEVPLRRAAVAQTISTEDALDSSKMTSALIAWLPIADADAIGAPQRTNPRNADEEEFDRAVAAELLATARSSTATIESTARRRLLSILAESDDIRPPGKDESRASPASPPIQMQLQSTLDDETAFAAYLDGDTRGVLLWVTRDTAVVLPSAAPETIRDCMLVLRELLLSPAAGATEIDAATQRLSDALLKSIPGVPPKRLLVLADDSFDGIPWAALRWPGHTEPLIETTATSLVRLARASPSAAREHSRPTLHILTAAQRASNEKLLPPLANADVEQQQIADSLNGDMRIETNSQVSRAAVLDALLVRGDFVHIAAHGTAQPQRVGYAGIWLEPSAGGTTPPFLSWLDILNNGVRADLVVLNACQLADSGAAVNGNLSFADAVSRAGARRVVASLWPVSDAAAALWVPAFYTALRDNPDDAAGALRAAQLRLAHSRAFAHPFFWAGMQAIERLDIPSAPVAASAVAARTVHQRSAANTAMMH